jgi:hypothetical protein
MADNYLTNSDPLLKVVDETPAPKAPEPPKPPVGWDAKTPPSYKMAHDARK